MEDLSVDVGSMIRSEILSHLNLATSKQTADKLKGQLVRRLLINHPIKNFLSSLKPDDIKKIYLQLGKDPMIKHFERMKKSIAEEFIEKCPWAPLTALNFF